MQLITTGLFLVAALMPFVRRVDGSRDAALSYPVAKRHLPCVCTLEYDPVCGSDGNDYSNKCLLRCAHDDNVANGRPPIVVAGHGLCPRVPCSCPKINYPVCGTDKQTYANDCLRRCENVRRAQYGLPPVLRAYYGICRKGPYTCPSAIIPVCGTDGKTYRNACILYYTSWNLEAQGQKPIRVAYPGPCKKEVCLCRAVKNELCASNGVTYLNRCTLDCQNRRLVQLGLKPLSVQYPGKCVDCICPAVYDPVCASDRKTYPNSCKLSCLNEKRKRLGLHPLLLRYKGECGCACTKEYKPVCASDKRTKSNLCIFDCENKERVADGLPPLEILHPGKCQKPCNCTHCSKKLKPVCGSDKKVYWNICRFDCNNACRKAAGLPPIKVVKCNPCDVGNAVL